jgi:hypothetical protein
MVWLTRIDYYDYYHQQRSPHQRLEVLLLLCHSAGRVHCA